MSDTLFGFVLPPFYKTKKRKAIKRSKFYFFDVGVQASLSQRGQVLPKTELFGKAFEHFLIQEIRAYLSYTRSDHDLCYWRSTSQMEVDVVIGNHTAIEIKATERIGENHLKGLRALREEKMHKNFIALSTDPIERNVDGILCMPWNKFLNRMWTGELF